MLCHIRVLLFSVFINCFVADNESKIGLHPLTTGYFFALLSLLNSLSLINLYAFKFISFH